VVEAGGPLICPLPALGTQHVLNSSQIAAAVVIFSNSRKWLSTLILLNRIGAMLASGLL
jgi:hypothetical protein